MRIANMGSDSIVDILQSEKRNQLAHSVNGNSGMFSFHARDDGQVDEGICAANIP